MSGELYIVATPIGNLGDMTERAREMLSKVDYILAEDTRVTRKLLEALRIDVKVKSYHQHSKESRKFEILNDLIKGNNIALVSDAGTPGISDPGNELVGFIYDNSDIRVIPIPGASAVTTALSVSGFDTQSYLFGGFFPRKKRSRIGVWFELNIPLVFFESSNRIVKTLEWIRSEVGERRVFVARELTKMHETHYRGEIGEVIDKLGEENFLKGEIVFVVEK